MDIVRIRANLANTTDNVGKAVLAALRHRHAVETWERADWTPITTGSVDAAEYVAKAIMARYGLSPREVHFLDALAGQLQRTPTGGVATRGRRTGRS